MFLFLCATFYPRHSSGDCSFLSGGGLSVQTRPGGCAVSPEILRHTNAKTADSNIDDNNETGVKYKNTTNDGKMT